MICEITKGFLTSSDFNPEIIMEIFNSNFRVRFSKHILLLYSYSYLYNCYIIIVVLCNIMIFTIVVVRVIHLDVYNVIIPAHISRRTTIHKGIAFMSLNTGRRTQLSPATAV